MNQQTTNISDSELNNARAYVTAKLANFSQLSENKQNFYLQKIAMVQKQTLANHKHHHRKIKELEKRYGTAQHDEIKALVHEEKTKAEEIYSNLMQPLLGSISLQLIPVDTRGQAEKQFRDTLNDFSLLSEQEQEKWTHRLSAVLLRERVLRDRQTILNHQPQLAEPGEHKRIYNTLKKNRQQQKQIWQDIKQETVGFRLQQLLNPLPAREGCSHSDGSHCTQQLIKLGCLWHKLHRAAENNKSHCRYRRLIRKQQQLEQQILSALWTDCHCRYTDFKLLTKMDQSFAYQKGNLLNCCFRCCKKQLKFAMHLPLIKPLLHLLSLPWRWLKSSLVKSWIDPYGLSNKLLPHVSDDQALQLQTYFLDEITKAHAQQQQSECCEEKISAQLRLQQLEKAWTQLNTGKHQLLHSLLQQEYRQARIEYQAAVSAISYRMAQQITEIFCHDTQELELKLDILPSHQAALDKSLEKLNFLLQLNKIHPKFY